MAVAGGATGAFFCVVQANELVVRGTTTLKTECLAVDVAVDQLSHGKQVLVQASEITRLREALKRYDVNV